MPKLGSDKMRPLGIPAHEDKLVQMALVKVLTPIYEEVFTNISFGFRPGRSQHDALKALNNIFSTKRINYVLDADIKGFFDHVDHKMLMEMISLRIADPNIYRYIVRFLKAGVMEEGAISQSVEGTPQGGVISPLLANIYLHYVLDDWFIGWRSKLCKGQAYMVRYADDFVCCFQYGQDATNFYKAMTERFKKFNLEVAEEKTKIIRFGRFAEKECKENGEGKPDTFDFLGFTHYCSKCRDGRFRVKRKTSRKKFKACLQRIKQWMQIKRTTSMDVVLMELKRKLFGHYRYYGITDNSQKVWDYYYKVRGIVFKWLNRRSQKKSFIWDKFHKIWSKFSIPTPRVYVNIFDLKAEFKF
ncbi:MAG: group II intron reverse transcriptase/maturase [Candidatus Xenobiia bacterium LiM19]